MSDNITPVKVNNLIQGLKKMFQRQLRISDKMGVGIMVCLIISLQNGYAQQFDLTATRKGENAWDKDIAGRKLRQNRKSRKSIDKKEQSLTGNRILSVSAASKGAVTKESITKNRWDNNRTPLVHKFSQYKSIGNYKGNLKAYKTKLIGQPQGTQFGGGINLFEASPGYFNEAIGNHRGNLKAYKTKLIGQPQGTQFRGRINLFEASPGYFNEAIGNHRGNLKAYKTKLIGQPQGTQFRGRINLFEASPGYFNEAIGNHRGNLKAYKTKLIGQPQGTQFRGRINLFEASPGYFNEAIGNHRGNLKVQKNYDRNMHPSSKHTTSLHSKNSLEAKKKLLKFNIWFVKLFKKNENQPTVVKEKIKTPRYDKREQDLWND